MDLVEAYKKMFSIRLVEERLLDMFSQGLITGTVHTCIGQEVSAVGVIGSLVEGDIIVSNHRCHGHYLARYMDVKGLVSEIMGLESGICHGNGGSQHLYRSNFYTNGIQGGMVPAAVGMALAENKRNNSCISVVFIGDGTLGQGVVYESMNIASLWSVPILFVIENNMYAQSTPISLNLAGEIADRPRAFGIKTQQAGNDLAEIHSTAVSMSEYVRKERKPACMIINTYRLAAHSKGDDNRDEKELNYWKEKDPMLAVRDSLGPSIADDIEKECKDFVKSEIDGICIE
ncbi:MAG: thiamine pyrophosphate-dependent dehydrogenase E1 component subunit alpha [Mariprofundaceae bacterium]|nr:thiamine pyrophosphate-dependent dehydrogenase E1 component subunit alpha [Mariprofundaceae bacterium]